MIAPARKTILKKLVKARDLLAEGTFLIDLNGGHQTAMGSQEAMDAIGNLIKAFEEKYPPQKEVS